METTDYVVLVSSDGRNWGQSHHAMGSYTLERANVIVERAARIYDNVKIMKQTTTLEEV